MRIVNRLVLWPVLLERFTCAGAMTAFTAIAGPIGRVLGLAPWQVGATVTIAGATWTLLARPWGRASDRIGRRPVMLTGVAGFVVSYAAIAVFVDSALDNNYSVATAFFGLVITRGLAGAFYAGVQPTTVALIADYKEPAERAGTIALLGAATGAGLVFGPALAGLAAPLGLGLALFMLAPLPLLALIALALTLPREAEHPSTPKTRHLALSDPRLRRPVVSGFVAMFSVTIAQVTIGFYAIDRLAIDPEAGARVAGFALASVGVALIVSQISVRRLGWPPEQLLKCGTGVAAIGFGLTTIATSAPIIWCCYFIAAFGMGWVWPSVSALASIAVDKDQQGAAAGSVSAAQGLGTIVGPLVGTLIYSIDIAAPYVVVSALLGLLTLWPRSARHVTDTGDASSDA